MNANPDFVLLDEEDSKIESIGKYRVLSTLGSGGMGVVFKARDPEVGRDVAIKTLKRTKSDSGDAYQDVITRFRLEARSAGNLRHPNIVTVFEANYQDGLPYIVMEYIEGDSLDALLEREKKLSLKMALHFLDQVAGGIDYAHSKGVIHRDIKPSNILIDKASNAYILDFGVANLNLRLAGFQNQLTKNPIYGTPGYMAPEQLLNRVVDHRSDLFSLGVVLFECLCGQKPFQGSTVAQIIDNTIQGNRPKITALAPELPPSLDAIFDRALSVRPELRFEGAELMMAAFFQALGSEHDAMKAREQRTLSFSTKAERLAESIAKVDVGPAPEPKKKVKIERPSEAMTGAFEPRPDGATLSAWDWQQRSSGEGIVDLLSSQRVLRKTPGGMFAHVGESISDIGGGSAALARLRALRKAALIVGPLLILGIGALFLADSARHRATPAVVAAPPEPVISVPVIPVPENVPVEDLTNREVLALVMNPQAPELRVIEALNEGRRRGVPRLVDIAPVVLQHSSPMVRGAAAQVYASIGDRRVLPQTIVLLEDNVIEVRRAAATAMLSLGDSKSLDYLRFRYANEADAETKAALKAAIEHISGIPVR